MKDVSNIVFSTIVLDNMGKSSGAVARFADVPSFEFDFGGTNVVDHHELDRKKCQPWKAVCEVVPVGIDESVYIGISPIKPYFAESGNAGGW